MCLHFMRCFKIMYAYVNYSIYIKELLSVASTVEQPRSTPS